jgi:hypothetical protein
MTGGKKWFGKYRATVANNIDPLNVGRLQVQVSDGSIAGASTLNWALPCFPIHGITVVPPVGAHVWIEYEAGDPDYPIWTGVFYLEQSDLARLGSGGSFSMALQTGETVVADKKGIRIANGKGASITLVGPTVDINDGALTVS